MDRISFVGMSKVRRHIDADAMPEQHGGAPRLDVEAWITGRIKAFDKVLEAGCGGDVTL